MKLKYEFSIMEMDDAFVAVATGDNAHEVEGVIRLNATGARIFELLSDDISKEDLVSTLLIEYNTDKAELTSFVDKFLQQIDDADLLQ